MKTKIFGLLLVAMGLSSCEDFLTRDPMDKLTDSEALWNNGENFRLMNYAFYDVYFEGYDYSWNRADWFAETDIADWNDDNAQKAPTFFTKVAPESSGWWDFAYVRRHNQLIDRASNSTMDEATKNHWIGVSRLLRAMEYSQLVQNFGDVPWFDKVIEDTDYENLYKPRDPRATVMDNVMADLQFACEHILKSDGTKGLAINQAVALAYTSRLMLFEGTWQKYRAKNNELAKKYLQVAKDAADKLMAMGDYRLHSDWKELTSSISLAHNPEVILYREYEMGVKTHSLMSFQNTEAEGSSPSRSLVDSYLSANGLPIYQAENTMFKGDKWFFDEMADRDPRLYGNVRADRLYLEGVETVYATSGYFAHRFVNDAIKNEAGGISSTNITDAPVMKLNEVMMNYIEAAVELADLGAYTLSQNDFDKTINALRDRPSTSMPHVTLSGNNLMVSGVIINDPKRDMGTMIAGDYEVKPIIWEVRRERRVELAYEGIRFNDLRRWSKLHYADMKINPDLNKGAWLDKDRFVAWYNEEFGANITVDDLKSVTLDREGNAGYIKPAILLREYAEKDYLYPIPTGQITLYEKHDAVLTQNPGW